ncbi:putative protein-S-isoprenylcysteine methyltransferase [Longilinea arvoryzae]|uniref:Protein-S-isoprenylcysteine O-methyltransferase Ste14 n=1 Tax=Longilinea arvoryzae TaxID=360412 RepID=A0A0S7BEI2_9CHLR|nr:isoprenylcysteine carboxylmethyltransferase family protein [Longilinea arvoryzae]GAP13300.1 putative protein-S-isoprenylcysteine methyltransferase [Longilinea arvoryzae]
MIDRSPDWRKLIFLTLARFLGGMALIAALFFGCAGRLDYWQAWAYLAMLAALMTATFVWLLRNEPDLLERRTHTRERDKTQKWVIGVSGIVLTLLFVLPGLDRRFAWSQVPFWLALLGLALAIAGYGLYFWVIQANRFASRVIEVSAGQKVIDSGPYAWVRHPMYLAILIFLIGTSFALASYWTLVPSLAMAPVLAVRAFDEEKTLRNELPGYVEYTQKVRWRLFPGVW